MAKKNEDSNGEIDPNARLVTTDADRAKAQKWFERARELGDKKSFDYAVEYYVNGLEFWPDAVEDACKPLHGCSVARRMTGGKKPGLKDTMKRSLTDKDVRKALVNALWLFGHDPENLAYIEGVLRNACRLRAEDAAQWAATVALKALDGTQKVNAKSFQATVTLIEELADRATERGEHTFAVEALQTGVQMLAVWRRRIPKDQSVDKNLKDLSTKLTILKGKYRSGGSFRDSIADADDQRELQDQERSVQADDRIDELIATSQQRHEADPTQAGALRQLVDLLCRREREDDEMRAIGFLVAEYKRSEDYRWKQSADDIRMKQLARASRHAQKAGDQQAVREAQTTQLRYELKVFKDRIERYPTDHRIKFEYAVRCFTARKYDEAIPLFQAARIDPKNRIACGLYLGRCFFRKGYHSQAVAALQGALDQYDVSDDSLAKDLQYWLARTYEADGKVDDARNAYGIILQLDYNYRDVRGRLDGLESAGTTGTA